MESLTKINSYFIYLVLGNSRFERLNIIKAICSKLQVDRIDTYKISEGKFGAAISQLNTQPLFSDYSTVLLEDIETLSSAEWDIISKIIDNPPKFSYLILSGLDIDKKQKDLYLKLKAKGVVTNFNEEKPWDKEKRVATGVVKLVKSLGKDITQDALNTLLKMAGFNSTLLENEVKKVGSFVGDRSKIELVDVQTICSKVIELDGWKIAEEIVWRGRNQIEGCFFEDVANVIALVGQIRYHFQMALQIKSMIDEELSKVEIVSFFHRLRPAKVEEYIEIAKTIPISFFKRGLQQLYTLEKSMKGSFMDAETVFNIFFAKLC